MQDDNAYYVLKTLWQEEKCESKYETIYEKKCETVYDNKVVS